MPKVGNTVKNAAKLVFPFWLITTAYLHAAEPEYRFVHVKTILGPCCSDGGNDMVVAEDGAVWVVGFRGGLDLDRDGSVDIQTLGSPEPLVLRHFDDERDNRKRGWVDESGGPGADPARSVVLDRRGGAYVAGTFVEHVRFGRKQLFSEGRSDGFLVRYDADGQKLWAVAIGGEGEDEFSDIDSDSAGNVYVTGTMRGEIDVDQDGEVDIRAEGQSVMFMASFDPAGNLRWARASGGTGAARGVGIAIAPDDSIYLSGFYLGGPVDLDGDGAIDLAEPGGKQVSQTVTPQTDIDGYYAKFTPEGDLVWSRIVSGPQFHIAGSLAFIGDGDLLVLGSFSAPADLDGDGSPDLEFQPMGDRKWEHNADANSFLLRVSPDGKLEWAQPYFGAAAKITSEGGRILMAGQYQGALDLDGDGVLEREADPDSERESFAAILDGKGVVQQTITIVGDSSDIAASAVFSPDLRNLYVTGYTKLGADFDGDGEVEFASACHQIGDYFLARYEIVAE